MNEKFDELDLLRVYKRELKKILLNEDDLSDESLLGCIKILDEIISNELSKRPCIKNY